MGGGGDGGFAGQPHDPLCPGSYIERLMACSLTSFWEGDPPSLSTLSETWLSSADPSSRFPSWHRSPAHHALDVFASYLPPPKDAGFTGVGFCCLLILEAPAAAHSRPTGKTHRVIDGTQQAFSPFLAASAQPWPLLEALLEPLAAQLRGPAPAPGPGLVPPPAELLSLHLEQLPRAAQAWWPHARPCLALHSGLTVMNIPPSLQLLTRLPTGSGCSRLRGAVWWLGVSPTH